MFFSILTEQRKILHSFKRFCVFTVRMESFFLLPSVSAGCRFVSWEGGCRPFKISQSKRPTSQIYPKSSEQRPQENCRASGNLSTAVCEYMLMSATLMLMCAWFSFVILFTSSWTLWMQRPLIMSAASNPTIIRKPSRKSTTPSLFHRQFSLRFNYLRKLLYWTPVNVKVFISVF